MQSSQTLRKQGHSNSKSVHATLCVFVYVSLDLSVLLSNLQIFKVFKKLRWIYCYCYNHTFAT